jgi:hypothetical protein
MGKGTLGVVAGIGVYSVRCAMHIAAFFLGFFAIGTHDYGAGDLLSGGMTGDGVNSKTLEACYGILASMVLGDFSGFALGALHPNFPI